MADIPLRTYLEEVDGMIEGNRIEEAIAHLKHVLGIYPKNLEAYRLLAKALLEKNRHLDAADVFQRVLSSVPDDFIAHIGMAVVREDEGNIDAAIWHMERAYEVQPSNGPVQEELRRLYAKRDGAEPPRLRLSRAALARMYEKGSLYPQAIAELRAALKDDPERLDLKVLLASALWRTRQRAEAAETSAKLLEVLPFCREANRILAHVWTEEGHPTEAENYRRRLTALDPYEAFADPAHNGMGVQLVAPENVRVPRLESVYGETSSDAARPDWMEALGIQYDQPAPTAAEANDWLSTVTGQEETAEGQGAEAQGSGWLEALRGEGQTASANVPDWMSPTQPAPEFTPVDTPDWLSGLAPTESADAPPAEAKAVVGATDWLSDVFGQGSALPPDAAQTPAAPAAEPGDVPDWLQVSMSDVKSLEPAPPAASGMTGWLDAIEGQAPQAEATESAAQPSSAQADLPSWMLEDSGEDSAPPTAVSDSAPDWLTPSAVLPADSLSLLAGAESVTAAAPGDELPEWLKPADQASGAQPAPTQAQDLPDWLDGADEEAPAAPAAGIPDWLQSAEDTVVAGSTRAAEPAAPPTATDSNLPDWLASEDAAERSQASETPNWMQAAPAAPSDISAPEAQADWLDSVEASGGDTEPELPDWLRSSQPTATPADEAAGLTDADKAAQMARAAEEIPDWMASAGWVPRDPSIPLDNVEDLGPQEALESEAEMPAEPAELPEWLKAAKPQEEPAPAPQASSDAPDWLRSAMEGPEGAAAKEHGPELPSATRPQAGRKPVTADDLPQWLRDSKSDPGETIVSFLKSKPMSGSLRPQPTGPDATAGPPQEDAEVPDWLKGVEAESAGGPPETPSPAPSASAEAAAGAPDPESMSPDEALAWLEGLATRQGVNEEELVSKPKSELPDWVRKPPPEEPTEAAPMPAAEGPAPEAQLPEWLAEPAQAAEPASLSEDEALAWLESLAAQQGAAPEELVTKPEDRQADMPSWVQESVEIAARQPPEPELDPLAQAVLPADELPEWLRESNADVAAEQVSTEPQAEAAAEATSDDQATAWLEALAANQAAAEEDLAITPADRAPAPEQPALEPASEVLDEKPDWLKQMEAEADAYEAARAPEPSVSEPAPEFSEDQALAWLESLAAKQGAASEELVSKPEARGEEVPAWIQAQAETAAAEEATGAESEEPAVPAAEALGAEAAPEGEVPAWLATDTEAEPAEWSPPPIEAPQAEAPHLQAAEQPAPAWLDTLPAPDTRPPAPAKPRPTPSAKAEPAKQPARKAPPKTKARRKAAKLRPSRLRRSEDPEIVLALARKNMVDAQISASLDVYSELIAANQLISDIIADLEAATQSQPGHPELLRTLGDAFMRDNQLQRALETYKLALNQL